MKGDICTMFLQEPALQGEVIDTQKTIRSYLALFVDDLQVKDSTLNGYKVCLRQFALWMGDNCITQPTRDDIKAYRRYLDTQDFTAGTKSQYLRAVRAFFRWAASEGLYENIADGIKGAKVRSDNTKKEAFSGEDAKIILDSIDRTDEKGKRDYAMILLSITGGLRIIELQRADIGDIKTLRGERVLYIQGKGHDEKDAYKKLFPEASDAIDEYLNARTAYKKNDPLFASVSTNARQGGTRLTEPSISRMIKTRFKAAGYDSDKLTAHSLRHTANTLLFKSGADLYTVQRFARHADPKTTEIYLHSYNRDADHSEQIIYNEIFNPESPDILKQATDILCGLTYSDQLKALEYIKQLKHNTQNTDNTQYTQNKEGGQNEQDTD
jgi:integrase/recombinase XerC